MTEWRLSAAEIKSDLERGTPIERSKESTAGAPTGTTDDTVLETMVKGKLQADSKVGKAMIEVDAQNGAVKLSGSASQAEEVARAMALALDTQGVSKVTSEIKVDSSSNTSGTEKR
jgi:osmotically-inducible protein OsmY